MQGNITQQTSIRPSRQTQGDHVIEVEDFKRKNKE